MMRGAAVCTLRSFSGEIKRGFFEKTVDDANNEGAKLTLFRCAPGGAASEIGADPPEFARICTIKWTR